MGAGLSVNSCLGQWLKCPHGLPVPWTGASLTCEHCELQIGGAARCAILGCTNGTRGRLVLLQGVFLAFSRSASDTHWMPARPPAPARHPHGLLWQPDHICKLELGAVDAGGGAGKGEGWANEGSGRRVWQNKAVQPHFRAAAAGGWSCPWLVVHCAA